MTDSRILKRSFLYTPASRLDRVQKALEAGVADVVIADLEDGTAPADKARAREDVAKFLKKPPTSRSVFGVRINAWPGATAQADLAALRANPPTLLVLPKVESLDDVKSIAGILGEKARETRFVAMIETAKGLLHAAQIAQAGRLEALVFGSEDYAASVGAVRTAEGLEILYARSHVVACAAAAGVDAVDQVWVDYRDVEGLRLDAAMGARLGYSGKQVIHPDQVVPVHEAFAPTAAEVEKAKQIIAASQAAGGGVAVVEGRMIDKPLVDQAKKVLSRSQVR
jgi:citrate lyase subunit beta / citryl-CoA lyase